MFRFYTKTRGQTRSPFRRAAHTHTALISQWIFGPDGWTMSECIRDPPMEPTLVRTLFREDRDETEAESTIRYRNSDTREAALATGMTEGMEMGYARLETTL